MCGGQLAPNLPAIPHTPLSAGGWSSAWSAPQPRGWNSPRGWTLSGKPSPVENAVFHTPPSHDKITDPTAVIPGYTMKWIWAFEESAGASTFTDSVEGETLTLNQSGEFRNGPIDVGRYTGGSISGSGAVECFGINSNHRSDLDFDGTFSHALLDGTAQFAFLIEWKAATGTSGVFGLTQFGGGSNCRLQNIAGAGLRLRGNGGTALHSLAGHSIGALHRAVVVVDQVNGVWKVFSNAGESTDVFDSSDLGGNGKFALFDSSTISMAGQISYFAVMEGPQVESLTRSEAMATFKHGTDPSGALIDYALSGALTDVVGEDPNDGVLMATYGENQIALGWSSTLSPGAGFGLRGTPDVTNLLGDGVAPENWNKSVGTSVSTLDADLAESPRGFMEMRPVLFAAAGDTIVEDVACSAETQYSLSLVLQRVTGGTETLDVELVDTDNSSIIATQEVTLDHDKRVRVDVTGTTGAGATSLRSRIRCQTSGGGSIRMWAMTVVQGVPRLLVPTYGSTATVGFDAQPELDSSIINPAQGRIETTFVMDRASPDNGTYVYLAGTLPDGTIAALFTSTGLRCIIREADNSLEQNLYIGADPYDWTQETNFVYRYVTPGDLPERAENSIATIPGETVTGSDNDWTPGTMDRLRIAVSGFSGLMSSFAVYAAPGDP